MTGKVSSGRTQPWIYAIWAVSTLFMLFASFQFKEPLEDPYKIRDDFIAQGHRIFLDKKLLAAVIGLTGIVGGFISLATIARARGRSGKWGWLTFLSVPGMVIGLVLLHVLPRTKPSEEEPSLGPRR